MINHTTRQRINGLSVGDLDGIYTAPEVETINTIWVHYDPYLIVDADTIYSAPATVTPPANLNAIVYSSTAAELFWDRAEEPDLRYDVYMGDQLSGSTNGTSFFLNHLSPGAAMEIKVIARNSSGSQSIATYVTVQTPNDGNSGSTPTELILPTGLRASVYSSNTLELFWDRQGPGQLFEMLNSVGERLIRTDGTSYFASNLPVSDEYVFSVRTVDNDSNSSAPANIAVTVNEPGDEPAISIDNAESLLSQVVAIANRGPFEEAASLMSPGVSAVLQSAFSFFAEEEQPANGLTLIEGTAGGPDTVNFGGINGRQYACDAGGTANALSVFGGENSQGYIISLDHRVLPSGRYTGQVSYADGGRSGYSNWTYVNLEIIPEPGTVMYRYDGIDNAEYNRYRGSATYAATVNGYSVHTTDGEKLGEILDYQSTLISQQRSDQGSFLGIFYGEVTADIAFEADLPELSSSRYSVTIDLAYEYDAEAVEPAEPVDLWNSGSMSITATDGSQLQATLVDVDGDLNYESVAIAVGSEEIVRSLSDGYLVSWQ